MSDTPSSSAPVSLKERLHLRKRMVEDHQHPVNVVHHDEASFGERVADAAAAGIGSWKFLIIQTFAVFAWVSFNIIGLVNHWDPFPFILLNLLFSVQAAYTGPVLLLAGNRQAQKDRLTLEHAAEEAEKADQQNVQILQAIATNTELTERNTELTLQILQHLQAQVDAHMAADAATLKQA
jgi:uncharacterized membrane protein